MALITGGTERYQIIDCMYKYKRYKTIKIRHIKDLHYQIVGYGFEHEIFVLEKVKESQQRHNLFKYNNKRCNCKIKKTSAYIYNTNGGVKNKITTIQCRDTNCSPGIFDSSTAGEWHGPYLLPVTVKTIERSYFPIQWSVIWPLSMITSLSSQSESAVSALPNSTHFLMSYDSIDCSTTETKSNFCDIPSKYLKTNVNSNIKLLTYKKKKLPPQQLHQNAHHQISYFYLLMMFVTVVKEIVQYASESLYRMRRKTQFLLPILILLQLLMAAPLTNCTNPLNQTIAGVGLPSTSFMSQVTLMADVIPTPLGEADSMGPTASSAPSTISSSQESMDEKSVHQHRVSAIATGSSHRPTGGSSITSYLSKENTVRRDPSLSFISSGCHSCQMREQVKAENLESIKRHILLRLEMQSLPNITAPTVPHAIIENFYKNHSNFHSKKSTSFKVDGTEAERSSIVYTTVPLTQSNDFISDDDKTKHNDNNMQGDDPTIYSEDYNQASENDDEKDEEQYTNNYEDEFFSIVNSVYVFPTMPRMRHNRKAEILNFKLRNNEHSTVSQALLHVYIRGRDWIREYEPGVLDTKNNVGDDRHEIKITINRVVRRVNSTIATHTVNVTESQHEIPNGLGQWISIDVTQLVQGWLHNTTTNQGIVIKGSEGWMKSFITTGDSPNNKAFTVYIEMLTKDNRKRRTKRNTSMNCSESDNEERCCRYPLEVNFVEFEWAWVIAPTKFNAYFCNGECKLGFLEKYPHTHLMQLSTAPQPCCSPTKMSPLRLLYFNAENTLVMSTIPNMAVEKCSCS